MNTQASNNDASSVPKVTGQKRKYYQMPKKDFEEFYSEWRQVSQTTSKTSFREYCKQKNLLHKYDALSKRVATWNKHEKATKSSGTSAWTTASTAASTVTTTTEEEKERANLDKVNRESCERYQKKNQLLQERIDAITTLTVTPSDPIDFSLADAVELNREFWGELDVSQLAGFDYRMPREIAISLNKLETTIDKKKQTFWQANQDLKGGHVLDKIPDGICFQGWNPLTLQYNYWPVLGAKEEKKLNGAFVHACNFSHESIVEESIYETEIAAGIMASKPVAKYRRGGNGSGVPVQCQPKAMDHLNPSFVGKSTKTDRRYEHRDGGRNNNPDMIWESLTNGEKKRRRIQSDIRGVQRRPTQLRKRLESNKHYRHQTLILQNSRLLCQLVATTLKLESPDGFPDTLDNNNKSEFWQHYLASWSSYKERRDEWKQMLPLLTDYEIWLLEYSLMTGEIVNHEPLPAHCDTSSGHVMETLYLIGKVDLTTARSRSCKTVAEESMKHTGKLFCPLQNHGYLLRPSLDVMHALFTKTVHVPDRLRGGGNVSKSKHSPPKTR